MKIYAFKSPIMRLTMMAFLFSGSILFAQTSTTPNEQVPAETPSYEKMTKEEIKKDFETRMAKFDQVYAKLKQKADKTQNAEIKTDLNNMLAKMDAVKADMNTFTNGATAEQQQQEASKKLRASMEELRAIYNQMKEKYGKKPDPNGTPEQKEPAPK